MSNPRDLYPATRLRRAPRTLSAPAGTERVLLDPDLSLYYGLNDSGALVWDSLATPATLGELHQRMVDGFDVSGEAAWRDLVDLVDELLRAGLLEIDSGEGVGAAGA